MTKSCFHRVRVMVQKYFLSLLILRNNICFLCFLQFLLLILTQFKVLCLFFGVQIGYFVVELVSKNVFWSSLKDE